MMATKGPVGPATRHVLASTGPGSYPYDQYSTTYSVHYNPRKTSATVTFRHKGTGYAANFRPAVYYSKAADKDDNPKIARLLSDVYGSQTSRDFTRPSGPTGSEQLPGSSHCKASGFTHNLPFTRALSKHIASSSTQYGSSFPVKQFRSESLQPSGNSNKEESGFTQAYKGVEPITYRPNEAHAGDFPTKATWRHTGSSIMKHDYCKTVPLSGHEALPYLTSTGHRADPNGYIKGNQCVSNVQPSEVQQVPVPATVLASIKKKDPVAHTVITNPQQYTTLMNLTYRGRQHHHMNTAHTEVGNKELSGYAENHAPVVGTKHTGVQPTLHYTENFCSQKQQCSGEDTVPAVHPALSNGFTKSTRVHEFGPVQNAAQILIQQHPYVARSIICKDPCFVDLTYRHKDRSGLSKV